MFLGIFDDSSSGPRPLLNGAELVSPGRAMEPRVSRSLASRWIGQWVARANTKRDQDQPSRGVSRRSPHWPQPTEELAGACLGYVWLVSLYRNIISTHLIRPGFSVASVALREWRGDISTSSISLANIYPSTVGSERNVVSH